MVLFICLSLGGRAQCLEAKRQHEKENLLGEQGRQTNIFLSATGHERRDANARKIEGKPGCAPKIASIRREKEEKKEQTSTC